MTTFQRAHDIVQVLADTTRRQGEAADPRASVWVSANAGTGKTHVLSNRVLRLLLDGTPPERILCLTYTKAAAAEMSKRVFDKLAVWTKLSDDDLRNALAELKGSAASADELALARTLFARAIETPGGLKVQTIHAFCERILKRFPLEAGVSPDFAILDDETSARLLREATDDMLSRAALDRGSPLGQALQRAIAHASEDQFDKVLKSAIGEREWLDWLARLGADEDEALAIADGLYRKHFFVAADATEAGLTEAMARVLSDADIGHAVAGLSEGGKTDIKMADALSAARGATSLTSRVEALRKALLTKDGEAKSDSRFISAAVRAADPSLFPVLSRARDSLAALVEERRAVSVVEATMALARLALDVMQIYGGAKARRAALDFDDLIAHTARLLASTSSTDWVLFKLDGGLTHILVDESQDTSPTQWAIVEALTEGFFAAASADAKPRTLFAVGDEKQSIYSFQGAAPHLFDAKGRHFAERVGETGHLWRRLPLTLSFRTVEPVLAAVDAVFASPDRTPGVGQSIHHEVRRIGHAGLVELWETEKPEEATSGSVWTPLEESNTSSAAERLAAQIADRIAGWLANGEILPAENRRVRAGDVLILVRKRRPFAGPMVAALKARGIPVAGADRMRLSDQIAVADLIALGDFLTLPEDDLSLAIVLKSPLFNLDDDDLIRIAPQRKRTLWKALADAAATDSRYAEAVDTLRRWRKAADFDPPFEFLANLLDRDGMRHRFIARLGAECADGLDELLSLAIKYDESAPPSLPGFLAWLRSSDRVVKRDMEHGRDEVRVMTVHGAKGLEAPIVILPDTCTNKSGRQSGSLVALPRMVRHLGAPVPMCWPVRGAGRLDAIKDAGSDAASAEQEERNRLLYVAMTRARDRLYIGGFEGKHAPAPDSWHNLIAAGLSDIAETVTEADGRTVLRLASPQAVPPEAPKHDVVAAPAPLPLPAWAQTAAPSEPKLAVPLAPSRLAPYDVDAEGEPAPLPAEDAERRRLTLEPPIALPDADDAAIASDSPSLTQSPPVKRTPKSSTRASQGGSATETAGRAPIAATAADDTRFLRGTLTHALLEHLPSPPRARWDEAARAFLARRGEALTERVRGGIVTETLAILTDPAFAALFSPGSRAEVPIVAELARPPGKRGLPVRLTGQIDRLVVTAERVHIVDYKTNRPPPRHVQDVAPAYIFQLAAYRLALRKIYPGKSIEAALLWTDGPRMMAIPAPLLDEYEARLWDLDPE